MAPDSFSIIPLNNFRTREKIRERKKTTQIHDTKSQTAAEANGEST